MPSWHCIVEMNKYFWPLIVLDWEHLLTLPFYKAAYHVQTNRSADPDDHQQIPFKSLLFIPNDPIENQDYYTSTPVPKISSFAPVSGYIKHARTNKSKVIM